MNFHPPKDIVDIGLDAGIKKAVMPVNKILALSILAGAYIAFAAIGSTMAMHDIPSAGFARFIAGVVFSTGLMLVVICGAELFTGNTLLSIGYLENKISFLKVMRNWFWVYVGNIVGSVLLAYLMYVSGLWEYNSSAHGVYALKIALGKVNLTFAGAFARGILCNWLVCLAVWMAYSAKDTTGKILGIFFPIMMFITSAFEHSVANMYYLSAGLFLKQTAISGVIDPNLLQTLTLSSSVINNLIPVTLGNIVGGAFFVGGIYWYSFMKK